MTIIDKFFDSYKKLEKFLSKWIGDLDKKCNKNSNNHVMGSFIRK